MLIGGPGSERRRERLAMEIEDLYDLLPKFTCREGCTLCCSSFGVPSRTPVEDERIRQFLAEQGRPLGVATGTTCPYLTPSGCSIYPVRPLICRLYGTAEDYRCRIGVEPMAWLHPDLQEEIFHLYRTEFFPEKSPKKQPDQDPPQADRGDRVSSERPI